MPSQLANQQKSHTHFLNSASLMLTAHLRSCKPTIRQRENALLCSRVIADFG